MGLIICDSSLEPLTLTIPSCSNSPKTSRQSFLLQPFRVFMPCHRYIQVSSSCIIYPNWTHRTIPAQPHSSHKLCTGSVSISPADCPVYDKDWSDCENDLLAYLKVVSVECYTNDPRHHWKSYTNIAKITFYRHDHPKKFILVESPVLSSHTDPSPVNVRNVVLVTMLSSVVSQPSIWPTWPWSFKLPYVIMCMPIVVASIMYFIGAASPTSLSLR